MRRVVVRYTVRPERLAEHEALLQGVFDQLAEVRPAGLRYEVLRLDGSSFLHLASMSGADNPLPHLEAFQRFTADIGSRVEARPISAEATQVAIYGAESASPDDLGAPHDSVLP